MKKLTQIKIYTSHFPSESLLFASIPVLHRKFLKNFLYTLQENDSVGVWNTSCVWSLQRSHFFPQSFRTSFRSE